MSVILIRLSGALFTSKVQSGLVGGICGASCGVFAKKEGCGLGFWTYCLSPDMNGRAQQLTGWNGMVGGGRGRFCPSLGSFGLKYFLLPWTVILLSKKLFCFPHCYYRVLLISVLRKEVMLWREPRGVR